MRVEGVVMVRVVRVARLLHVLDASLNRTVNLLLDFVQGCPPVQTSLQYFVSLQKALQLVRKLEVLLCDHLHVPCEVLYLPLLLFTLLLQLIGLVRHKHSVLVQFLHLALKLLAKRLLLPKLVFKFVLASHLILEGLP